MTPSPPLALVIFCPPCWSTFLCPMMSVILYVCWMFLTSKTLLCCCVYTSELKDLRSIFRSPLMRVTDIWVICVKVSDTWEVASKTRSAYVSLWKKRSAFGDARMHLSFILNVILSCIWRLSWQPNADRPGESLGDNVPDVVKDGLRCLARCVQKMIEE